MNIIGDIGGEYDALIKLLALMPKAETTVLLGDLNDRGPKSKEVIEFAMSRPDIKVLQSNHGDMFVDFMRSMVEADYEQRYHYLDFVNNGGWTTLESYGYKPGMTPMDIVNLVPRAHINWLEDLPKIIETSDLILSHAAVLGGSTVAAAVALPLEDNSSVVWNRGRPSRRPNKFQVMGHNSHWGLKWFSDHAVCIDTSASRTLTGLHWPTRQIYQVGF
jgi:hypothetical protein